MAIRRLLRTHSTPSAVALARASVVASVIQIGCAANPASRPPSATSGSSSVTTGVATDPANIAYVYTCPDGFRFSTRFRGDSVLLQLPTATLTLPHVISADGAKYESGGVLFWNKGREARLETTTTARDACQGQPASTPWEEARLLGVEFRAVGQEPGWLLDLDEGHTIRYVGDYGNTLVTTPAPTPARDSTGTITYHAQTESHHLTLTIRETPCRDAMSGAPFAYTVNVQVDGHEVRGCGRVLNTGEVINTYWKLIEINGVPPVTGASQREERGEREVHIRLIADGSRVTGSTGCNTLAGHFDIAGDQVKFGQMATTRMACLDPALMSQEQDFTRTLEAVNRFTVLCDTLTLYTGERRVARFAAVYLR